MDCRKSGSMRSVILLISRMLRLSKVSFLRSSFFVSIFNINLLFWLVWSWVLFWLFKKLAEIFLALINWTSSVSL